MYCPENENLHIIETTLSEEQFEKLLPELMAQTKTARLVYDREGIMVLSSDDKERQERLLADGLFCAVAGVKLFRDSEIFRNYIKYIKSFRFKTKKC